MSGVKEGYYFLYSNLLCQNQKWQKSTVSKKLFNSVKYVKPPATVCSEVLQLDVPEIDEELA